MTPEDQDAEVGRLVRERRDLRAQHQALLSKGKKTGTLLSSVGKALTIHAPGSRYPANTLKFGKDGSVNVSDEYHAQETVTGQFSSAAYIRQLLEEVNRVEQQLSELDSALKAFGV